MEKSGCTELGVLYTAIAVLSFAPHVQSTFVRFESMADKRVNDKLNYLVETSKTLLRCAAHCAAAQRCLSVSHRESDRSCLLSSYNVNGSDIAQQLITERSWITLSRNKSGSYWIGLNDIEVEDKFVWTSSGTVPSYTSWGHLDPNGGRGDNCVVYRLKTGYMWADEDCIIERAAVCEML